VFTRTHYWILCWTRLIESVFSVYCFSVHFNIILRYTCNPPNSSFSPYFADQLLSVHATCSTYFILPVSNILIMIDEVFKIINLVFMHFSPAFWHFSPLVSKCSPKHLVLKHRQSGRDQDFYPHKTTGENICVHCIRYVSIWKTGSQNIPNWIIESLPHTYLH
jgi:hypothetical protein